MNNKQTTKYDEQTIKEYEESLTHDRWLELMRLRKIEREFARGAGWDYDNYWETMTLQELREAQQ